MAKPLRPMRSSSSKARRLGDLPVLVQHVPRAERDVLQRRQMREQLEMLEYHADPAAIGAERDACPAGPAADEIPQVLLAARRLTSRFRQRSNVVLPEPLGPMMHTLSPRSTRKSTPCNTSAPPKLLCRPRTSSNGVADPSAWNAFNRNHLPRAADPRRRLWPARRSGAACGYARARRRTRRSRTVTTRVSGIVTPT